ncbi:hypothetical protein D915_008969 [Fasciola hepatica]|uniref:INTS8 TPR repeats domain-containing protein n=1 Tax=Fasciola hepatica TaxID=6192 RepID=A0A4E0RF33_FASHE|nr:hypothetical protein D915_008969 [Fasciola hepatica]
MESRREKNWLFYLVQPTQLLADIPKMPLETKLSLLKQFLSQAELSDRKAFAANRVDISVSEVNLPSESRRTTDTVSFEGSDTEPPYKKSKILDALALQLAAVLKFNLNLFRTMYEIPTRLLARLYRVLVTVTAKNSAVLQPLFEQNDGKDNLFKINPYAGFDWRALHPTTTYAIFSYHVWCLQVSFASNMLPQPFRNLTPAVSGLTEIPDTVFFADNRVEISVVLERASESVAQLTQILGLLDEITLARPFPTAFPLVGPGLPPALGAPLDTEPEEADDETESRSRQSMLIRDAELLSREYLELSIKFILGRHAFQLQNFSNSEECFTTALNLMKQVKIEYAEEVGATVGLLETYLQACRSCHSDMPSDLKLSDSQSNPCEFVRVFCDILQRDWLENSPPNAGTPFWHQKIVENGSLHMVFRSPTRINSESLSSNAINKPTYEDHLYQILMEDLHVEDNAKTCEPIVPLGWSLRKRLEGLLLRTLIALHTSRSDMKPGRPSPAKQARTSPRAVALDAIDLFSVVQHLYTKVLVCNTIERLVSESFFEPAQFVTLLITCPQRTGESRSPYLSSSTPTLDPVCAYEFLFDCLDCFLHVLSTQPEERAKLRIQLVDQYVLYTVQQGLALLGQPDWTLSADTADLPILRRRFRGCLNALVEHDLLSALGTEVQNFVRSVCEMEQLAESSSSEACFMSTVLRGLPDPGIDLPTHSTTEHGLASLANGIADSLKLNDPPTAWSEATVATDSCTIYGSKMDIDMRGPVHPFAAVSPFGPFPPHPFRSLPTGHQGSSHPSLSTVSETLGNEDAFALMHASTIRLLLTTCTSSGVNTTVRKLLGVMPAARILMLNSAWISCLRRLATLEHASTSGSISDVPPDDTLLAPFFSVDTNSAGLLVAAVQLAKASLCLEHQTASPNRIQALLLSALSELTASTNTLCTGASGLTWFRAALRHELLLLDLLNVLDSSPVMSSEESRSVPAITGNNVGMTKTHTRRFYLNELSRRAKICLFLAAGLPANQTALENKMDANWMSLGLSNLLVCAAACYLLWNGERDFLLPSSKRAQSSTTCLPKGSLPARNSVLGGLDLIRALLRVHEAVSTVAGQLESGESGEKRDGAVPTSDGDTRPTQADRVKTAINNLWNLVVFGCLVPELANSSNGSENGIASSGETKPNHSRPQIQLPTMVTVARMLACSCAHNQTGRETDMEHPRADVKKRFSPSTPGARKSSPALYLLSYLITCLSHITHAVCPEFRVPKLPPLDVVVDTCMRLETDLWHCVSSDDSSKTDLCTGSDDTGRRKRSRWEPVSSDDGSTFQSHLNSSGCLWNKTSAIGAVAVSLLSDVRWPNDIPSNTKLPAQAMYELLLLFLNSGLTFLPTRIDWLLLRAEVEFHLNRPRAALVTYLEACAVATDSFLRPLPASIQCEEIVHRMVSICQNLGLLGEAIVLCQLAPQGALIEVGLHLITCILDLYTSGSQAPETIGSLPTGEQANGPESHGSAMPAPPATAALAAGITNNPASRSRAPLSTFLTERPRGACGGFLAKTPWDCLDPLVDYLWDVQLLETLSANALNQGSLSVHARFNACLSLPELNVNNRDEILQQSVEARTLDFLRWMANQHL